MEKWFKCKIYHERIQNRIKTKTGSGYWFLAAGRWLLAAGSSLLVKIILPEASDKRPGPF
jgi:hypothetical protein